jgi:hypothetical protein
MRAKQVYTWDEHLQNKKTRLVFFRKVNGKDQPVSGNPYSADKDNDCHATGMKLPIVKSGSGPGG